MAGGGCVPTFLGEAAADRSIDRSFPMKNIAIAFVLALAAIGGAVTISVITSTYVAACPPGSSAC